LKIRCGTGLYLSSTHFCHNNSEIVQLCGGSSYDPSTHFCLSGAVKEKCGGKEYTAAQTCEDGTVYGSCGGTAYNIDTHICVAGALEDRCGEKGYDASNPDLDCQNNIIVKRCGFQWYDPSSMYFCYNNDIGEKCGINPQEYDPSLYECRPSVNANAIYLKIPVNYYGEDYEAVLIGTQTWMARNLNYDASGSRCFGDKSGSDSQGNCTIYGRLYNWATAMAGSCPVGWHLPSDAEWNALITAVGGSTTAGTKLKTASGWNAGSGYKPGTDVYGFAALPGGNGGSDGSFYGAGDYGYWWSSSEYNANYAYYRYVRYDYEDVYRDDDNKYRLFSVRCLQDSAR
jgi:uncharacterized protein (TIGR02145 family)